MTPSVWADDAPCLVIKFNILQTDEATNCTVHCISNNLYKTSHIWNIDTANIQQGFMQDNTVASHTFFGGRQLIYIICQLRCVFIT